MKLTGNTIFITGGGSGIGRGLAEALHLLGNQVIISGRRKSHLVETIGANPGMKYVELNIADTASIAEAATQLIVEHPKLNVLINNAGIMHPDNAISAVNEEILMAIVMTNLMGPIRMTSALIEHLKRQDAATVINVSSVLGFVPMASAAIYCSTKAALHSYTQSLRYKLRGSSVTVLELIPPWVRTDLLNSSNEPRAMPLHEFIAATMQVLGTDTEEVLVEQARQVRNSAGAGNTAFVTHFNDAL